MLKKLSNDLSIYWEEVHINILEKCTEEQRLKVAKKCLIKWDLLSKIDIANEEIKPEMDRIKKRGIGFKGFNSPTEKLNQYINVVKQNLKQLADMLNIDE